MCMHTYIHPLKKDPYSVYGLPVRKVIFFFRALMSNRNFYTNIYLHCFILKLVFEIQIGHAWQIHTHTYTNRYPRDEVKYTGSNKTSFSANPFQADKSIDISFRKTGQDEDRWNRCLGYWWLSRYRKSLRG